jgi:hypothetical protein
MEEAIIALLVVPSPCNLLLPREAYSAVDRSLPEIDGLLYTARILQTLGEAIVDENKCYYAPIALKEEHRHMFTGWNVHYPRGRPADKEQKLRWLAPAARMFGCMKKKEVKVDSKMLLNTLERALAFEKGLYKPHSAASANNNATAQESESDKDGNDSDASLVKSTTDDSEVESSKKKRAKPKNQVNNTTTSKKEQDVPKVPKVSLKSVEAQLEPIVISQYSTQYESLLMVNWLIDHHNALDKYEIGNLHTALYMANANSSNTSTYTFKPPSSWRAEVTVEERQIVMQRIHNFLVAKAVIYLTKSVEDYQNKLQVFELALLTLASNYIEYMAESYVISNVPRLISQFQAYVLSKLKDCVYTNASKRYQEIIQGKVNPTMSGSGSAKNNAVSSSSKSGSISNTNPAIESKDTNYTNTSSHASDTNNTVDIATTADDKNTPIVIEID